MDGSHQEPQSSKTAAEVRVHRGVLSAVVASSRVLTIGSHRLLLLVPAYQKAEQQRQAPGSRVPMIGSLLAHLLAQCLQQEQQAAVLAR